MSYGVPVTPVHSAEITFVPIGTNFERSAFRHVYVKQMSAFVCVWDVDICLRINTLGAGYVR